VLASTLSEGSISYLYYADRLVQLPLGFIAIPLASVAFPLMAHQVRSAMGSGIADTLERSLRFILFLSFPALAGLIVLRLPIFSVLFQRGAFGHREALLCSDALLYYSLGLWAFAGLQILPRALYATDELWTPVKAGSVSVGANLALSLILLGPMGYGGLALANSLAAILYFLTLLRPLSRGLGRALIRKMAQPISRFLIASALMAIAVRGIASMGQWDHGLNGMNILVLGAAIGTGLASYLLLARVAGFPELREMGILKDNSRAERH